MRQSFEELLESLSKCPGIYVGSVDLYAVCHFLDGYSLGIESAGMPDPLKHWREWIYFRFKIYHSAWGWPRVLHHVYMTEREAILRLPELYKEFQRALEATSSSDFIEQTCAALLAEHGRNYFEPSETHTSLEGTRRAAT